MSVADPKEPELQKFVGDSKPPVAVLATADGSPINKVENNAGKLKIDQVEKAVDAEMKQRENALDAKLKDGQRKRKGGRQRRGDRCVESGYSGGLAFSQRSQKRLRRN